MHINRANLQHIWARARAPLIGALLIGTMIQLVFWGGAPHPGPLVLVGAVLLSGMMLAFGLLAWWLYLSPLPSQPAPIPNRARVAELRQLIAAAMLICGVLFYVGTMWDAAWHRRFGSFGDDFLWPPHFMLYTSLALVALCAGGSLLLLLGRAGGLRARVRREPLIGMVGLMAAYMVASIPSDSIWHTVYGSDISAWSLPHILLIGSFVLIMCAAAAAQLSLLAPGPWRRLGGLRGQELIVVGLLVIVGLELMLAGIIEWDIFRVPTWSNEVAVTRLIYGRPTWLYPAVLVSIALLLGNLALHTLRRAGAATLVTLTMLGVHAAVLATIRSTGIAYDLDLLSYILIAPPALALDLWYATGSHRVASAAALIGGNLVAGAAFVAAGLPLIAATMTYPPITGATAPAIVVISLAAALVAGWIGATLGGLISGFDRPTAAPEPIRTWVRWATIGALTGTIVGATLYILTTALTI